MILVIPGKKYLLSTPRLCYTHRYDRKQQQLRAVEQPQLYRTPFTDPQLELWELDDEQWRTVLERAPRLRRARDQRGGPTSNCRYGLLGSWCSC